MRCRPPPALARSTVAECRAQLIRTEAQRRSSQPPGTQPAPAGAYRSTNHGNRTLARAKVAVRCRPVWILAVTWCTFGLTVDVDSDRHASADLAATQVATPH